MKVQLRLATAVAVLLLAAPAAAQAKTKSVTVGTPPATQRTLQKGGVDANAFFPGKVTINAGDSIKFLPSGFHTVDIPNKGGDDMLPLFTPTGQNVANSVDAAGAPFWFNGQPGLTFNPAFGKSSFGKKLTYTGAKRIESGLPPDKPKPLTVKFTKAGSFDIYCDIHPGMKGTVVVRKKGAAVPTAAQDSKAVKKQTAAAIAGAKGLATQSQPANTVSLGVAGKGGLEYFGMVPATLTVKTGTTVKFQMSPGSYEGHTATFGPGNPETEPASYLGQVTAGFERGDPRAIYPSNPPGAPFALTTTSHGNGFWNSGVLDAAAASPLPSSASVQFGAPGTYTYYCLIHPFMKGTVVVQ